MRPVRVNLGERSYTIRIGRGALKELGKAAGRHFPGGRALVVSDRNVGPVHGEARARASREQGAGRTNRNP